MPTADFHTALNNIEQEIARREMTSRGWSSYSDLLVLSQNPAVERLLRLLIETSVKMSAVCVATYAASVLTFLGTAAMLNQTPFGPTAVGESFQTLRRTTRQPTATPQPDRSADRNITTADLLTASLLVTTLTSSPDDLDFAAGDDEEEVIVIVFISLQGDRIDMSVLFWYLVKSDWSSTR